MFMAMRFSMQRQKFVRKGKGNLSENKKNFRKSVSKKEC